MYNFENKDTVPMNSLVSDYSDFPLQSPLSQNQNSFLFASSLTTSPEIHKMQQYQLDKHEISPQSQVLHGFITPVHKNAIGKTTSMNQKDQPCKFQHYDLPKQVTKKAEKQHPNKESQERFDEIQLLKQHLKAKYKHYTDEQLDEIIQKFINEYLQKLDNPDEKREDTQNDEGIDFGENTEEQSRASLSTHLDWNDKQELERYCVKQKRIQESQDFRPSQYFGAIKVDKLEDGIDDSRIDELFLDCFGIKPQKNQKESKNIQNQIHPQSYVPHQVVGNNNSVQNDQSYKIILNFYNQFQIMNQENSSKGQQQTHPIQYKNQVYQYEQNQNQQQEQLLILMDKTNQNVKTNQCQVLHQESKASNDKKAQKKIQKSPQEIAKFKHQKQISESIDIENNGFQNCCFKTDDNRQVTKLSHKGSLSKNYQTQINSPQSQESISRHLYNQSITHQSSMGNLSLSGSINKGKQNNLMAMNKQTYKSILYKHQNPNYHSICSSSSIENKPKQMNKLSYLAAKHIEEGQKNINEQGLAHNRINSSSTVKSAPKPPNNQSIPLSAKNARNSKDNAMSTTGFQTATDSFYNETSPRISPKSILQSQQPQIVNQFKLNSQTFTMQHANSTFSQHPKSLLQSHMSSHENFGKTLVQQSIDNFKSTKENMFKTHKSSVQGSSSARPQNQKTLGRNQSYNHFKTLNNLNGVQSFLMASHDYTKNKVGSNPQIQFIDTDEYQTSPINENKKYETQISSQGQSTSRPQTVINANFNITTGINQYMSNAHNLGKPPTKLAKGYLSHNSSVKNLKIQSKNLTLNTQTCLNSSRKRNHNQHQSLHQELPISTVYPQSTRNMPAQHFKFGTKPNSLSRERKVLASNKSQERTKLKSSTVKQHEHEMASMERKRAMYKTQKVQDAKTKFQVGNQKTTAFSKKSSNCRNQSGINKGKCANMISEYMKPQTYNRDKSCKRQDSSSRTMLKINKSLDKISQMFMNSPVQSLAQHPQSTKNSNNIAKVADIINQISNYQSLIKKAKVDKENDVKQLMKSKQTSNRSQKSKKDWTYQSVNIDGPIQAKKTVETYKKYLSFNNTQQQDLGIHSFK